MKKSVLLSSIILILVFSNLETVCAKSYSYSYINTSLNLERDGSVIVSQERAYDFKGIFSWAYLDLKKKGSEDIDFIQIKDLDSDKDLVYSIEEDSSHIKATWYYNANNQEKRFLIVYKIEGVVKRYEDVSEFYWKVIEDDHEYIKRFDTEIILPEPSPNLFKVFIHTDAEPGTLNFSDDLKKAIVSVDDIPKNKFVEFRVLTSPSIFTEAELIPKKMYENILDDEKRIVFGSMFSRIFGSIPLLIVIIAIPFVFFGYFYIKYGREPRVDYQGIYEHEPPSKIPPLVLGNLMSIGLTKTPINHGFIATIFDLARRGYLIIREESEKVLFFKKSKQRFILTEKGKKELSSPKLLSFEHEVLKFLFETVPSRSSLFGKRNKTTRTTEVTTSDIMAWSRSTRKAQSLINETGKDAKEWFEKNHFEVFEKKSTVKSNIFIVFSIIYLIFLFVLSFLVSPIYLIAVLIFVPLFIIAIFTMPILRRTYEATLEIKKWKAFKRFINDFSAMKDAPTTLIHIWDEYLIYAIVLGVTKKLLKNLKRLAIERNMTFYSVAWYQDLGGSMTVGSMSPEAFSSMITNLSSTVNALSSSSSVGGGFSGGGGGGGGGGSSGAG